jgi:hypothetical protein
MRRISALMAAVVAMGLSACGEVMQPTESADDIMARVDVGQLPAAAQQRAQWFSAASPEVMELAEAVYAANDDETGQLVFGIDHPRAQAPIRAIMARQGVPVSAYRIETASQIHYMNTTLRTEHRPTVGGIQIHWSNYVCTLGFNVDHAGGRSFITNSHCTSNQGTTGTTAYYQPVSSTNPTAIAIEAHDPPYGNLPGCSRGKKCRYSDASRALYQSGTESSLGVIAKTTGENTGSLTVSGSFTVTDQNNTATSYSGTIHKVGRTTGWTSGNVLGTCATVNVSGSNIQLLCQTLVQRANTAIVGGGDSGSPVFQRSGDNATLVGILWGGSTAGDLFVFSPLKNIQDELGGLTARADGLGGGTGGGGGGGGGEEPCVPKGKGNNCK